ncbi:MAG: DUF3298 and DUF4163 domain-containing protein [Anaerolineae bacterium]|nr:DUF3298 and DUF4163 domain-containing protein [Anaerolineae bacterium]
MKTAYPIAGLFLLWLFIIPIAAQETSSACTDQRGSIRESDGKCVIQSGMTMEIAYPLEIETHPFAQEIVDTYLQESRADFVRSYADASSEALNSDLPMVANIPWDMAIDYTYSEYSQDTFSLVLQIYTYTGGAHGNTAYKTWVFDAEAESVLTLDDIFVDSAAGLDAVAPLAQQDIVSRGIVAEGDEWMLEGTAPTPENYANYTLEADAITFYFPPYQVGSYALGTLEVHVLLDSLRDVLADRFQPATGE